MIRPSFTTSIVYNVWKISRPVIVSMFAVAVIIALIDVAFWAKDWKPFPTGLWLIIPYALVVSIVEYLGITDIVGVAPSMKAYIRFACTSTLVLLPVILAITLLFAAPTIGDTVALVACGAGLVAGVAIIAFLPAWPVAQAFSSSIVMPAKVFKATRGFRWGLVGAAILLSVFTQQDLVPGVDKATNLSHAFAYAAGEAGISTLSMIYTAAIAATAFIFACRNDEDLYPPRNPIVPSSRASTFNNDVGGASESMLQENHQTPGGEPGTATFWKATIFWVLILIGLTLVLAFVPGASSIPNSVYVSALVAMLVVFVFINHWKHTHS